MKIFRKEYCPPQNYYIILFKMKALLIIIYKNSTSLWVFFLSKEEDWFKTEYTIKKLFNGRISKVKYCIGFWNKQTTSKHFIMHYTEKLHYTNFLFCQDITQYTIKVYKKLEIISTPLQTLVSSFTENFWITCQLFVIPIVWSESGDSLVRPKLMSFKYSPTSSS